MLSRRDIVLHLPLLPIATQIGGCANGDSAMRERIVQDITAWDAIEDHRTGTQGDGRTAEWLAEAIRGAGLEPDIVRFPFERKVLHECRITVGGQSADGVPLFDGAFTDSRGLQAPLHPLADGTGIGVTGFAPSPAAPATADLLQARRDGQHAAIVAVATGESVLPGLALLNADYYRDPFGPPVLQIATDHGAWLEAAASERALAEFIAHVTLEQTSAANVQTRITGRDPSLAPLVIMTPKSAWWTCTSERAGGIGVWLECLRHFAAHRPERTIIFTANTGHELGHIGLDHYLASDAGLIEAAHAWIHLGANFAARDSQVLFQASSETLLTEGLAAFDAVGQRPARITPVGTRPLGEARNIYDGDGRYVSILGDNRWFHHPDDRWPTSVDIERTLLLTQAMLGIAEQLAGV